MIEVGKYYLYKGSEFPTEKVFCNQINYPYARIVRSNGDSWSVLAKDLDVMCSESNKSNNMLLPTDAQERKQIPITTGVLDYFPLAIAEVAKCSWAGNQQHHPDKPLHWDKTKSTDHSDCIARHLVDRGKFDTDGQRHSAKLAWRALALLQLELEKENMEGNV